MNTLAEADVPICASARPASVTLAPWLTRRSVGPRRLAMPGPNATELASLVEAAMNVSDHGRKRPCRVVVADAAQRQRYADAFLAYAAAVRGLPSLDLLDATVREHELTKAFNGPCLLSLVARIATDDPDIPPHEQWMSVGASLGALLGAAHALGYAGKALSGARIHHPAVRSVVCRDDELLACFVYLGSKPANC